MELLAGRKEKNKGAGGKLKEDGNDSVDKERIKRGGRLGLGERMGYFV